MRRWIALTTYDENGAREKKLGDPDNLDKMVVFTSGDGDQPMAGDLTTALDGYGGLEEGQAILLLPLDAGHEVRVRTTTNVEVTWSIEVA